MSQFLLSRKLVKYVNYENAELVLKLTKLQNNHTKRMVLLLYLKTNKIKYQFMLSINLLKSKSKYTHPYTILHHITDWPEQSWSFPWLRADYFLRLSFLNRCDLYFILVFRRKSSNSNFFQRWEP